MGVNISGKGVLSGLASLVAGVVNNLNLLVTRVIGYTNVPGTGGSSYYTTTVTTGSSGNKYIGFFGNFFSKGVKTSEDGVTWTTLETNLPKRNDSMFGQVFPWEQVIYGNGIYVAMTTDTQVSNNIATSTDGVNWTTRNVSLIANTRNLIFTNNKFYITVSGFNGIFGGYESVDGITWTPKDNLLNVVVGNNMPGNYRLVSAGGEYGPIRTYIEATDTWQDIPNTNGYRSVAYGELFSGTNGWVAIKEDGSGISSMNGLDWSSTTTVPHGTMQTAVKPLFKYLGNKFILLTGSDRWGNWYSTNAGVSWSPITGLDTNYAEGTIVYVNGSFLFVSSAGSGSQSYSSTNGIEWIPSTSVGLVGDSQQALTYGLVTTTSTVEIQVSIGNQGQEGAEILAPVDVYTVPTGKTTNIDEVRVKNNSANTITYDLGVLNSGVELTDQNALINDQTIPAGATATITSISNPLTAGQRIAVFPSAVDVVEVKVYGTESNI